MNWAGVEQALRQGLDKGVASAVSLTVGRRGELLFDKGYGRLSDAPDAPKLQPESVFDLASLTKPLATGLACLAQIELGLLNLNDPISRWLDLPSGSGDDAGDDKASLTPGQLLSHTAGLPAWRPYYRELKDLPLLTRQKRLLELIAAEPLEHRPGEQVLYSDLGYLLLQMIIEEISGVSLAEYVVMNFCQPLGLHDLGFVILPDGPGYNKNRFVASEHCPWRGRLLQGEVSDDNAWALGGFGGQAGMFGRGRSVFRLMDWLAASAEGRAIPRMLSPQTAGLIYERPEPRCPRTFGFDTPTGVTPSAGRFARGEVIGHLGFTGTSVWHRRGDGVSVVLLTNRIIHGRDNQLIRDFRVQIHGLVDSVLSD